MHLSYSFNRVNRFCVCKLRAMKPINRRRRRRRSGCHLANWISRSISKRHNANRSTVNIIIIVHRSTQKFNCTHEREFQTCRNRIPQPSQFNNANNHICRCDELPSDQWRFAKSNCWLSCAVCVCVFVVFPHSILIYCMVEKSMWKMGWSVSLSTTANCNSGGCLEEFYTLCLFYG